MQHLHASFSATIIHIFHSGTGAFSGDHCRYLSWMHPLFRARAIVLSILMVHIIFLFVLHPVGGPGLPHLQSSYPFC